MINQFIKRSWRSIGMILIFLLGWEFSVRYFAIDEWFLPAPSMIVREAKEVLPNFWPHLRATFKLSSLGLLIGSSIGLVVATLLHLNDKLRETFYPFLIISQNIPTIILAPLLVIWFGFGALPKLIIIVLACFFPIAVSTLSGLEQTDRELTFYMQMMGASKGQRFWKLELPYAVPSILSGLKIAATYSVMAAVISEWLGAQEGIGVFMTVASSSYQTARVFVAIMVTIVLSLGFFSVVLFIERLLIRFQRKGDLS